MSGFGWEGGGGGSLPSGFLQVAGGVPLDTTLRTITDGVGNASPLRLSTTDVAVFGSYFTVNHTSTPSISLTRDNNSNAIPGDNVGQIEFTGRRNGGLSSLSRLRTVYRGDGITRTSEFVIAVANSSGTMSDSFILGGSSFAQIPASSRAFLVGGNQFTATTYLGPAQMSVSNNLVVSNDSNHSISASARLHVRGDGTNPIARFEDNTGAAHILQYEASGRLFGQTTNSSIELLRFQRNNNRYFSYGAVGSLAVVTDAGGQPGGSADLSWINFVHTINHTSGLQNQLGLISTVSNAAGNMNYRSISTRYTINNTGVQMGNATGIFLNATETALNGMTHNLMDLQVNLVSALRVSRTGQVISPNGGFESTSGVNRFGNLILASRILSTTDGGSQAAIELTSTGVRILNILNLQFGGNTSSFPAIRRNGTGIDFVPADGLGFCDIKAGVINAAQLQTNTIIPQINGDISILNTWAGSSGLQIRTIANRAQVVTITPDTTNTLTSGTSNIVNVLTPFAPTSGTGVINAISVSGTINQTGGANGITRGLFINPTLTSAADFRAIETTNGKVIFANLPTSSAGLPSGALWNNAGVLNIV
jgi:hypothetical protein